MKFILLLALCSWSCVGETIDKLIFEDWLNAEIVENSENFGKIVLRPRLVFVLIDESGKVTEVSKENWLKIILN